MGLFSASSSSSNETRVITEDRRLAVADEGINKPVEVRGGHHNTITVQNLDAGAIQSVLESNTILSLAALDSVEETAHQSLEQGGDIVSKAFSGFLNSADQRFDQVTETADDRLIRSMTIMAGVVVLIIAFQSGILKGVLK